MASKNIDSKSETTSTLNSEPQPIDIDSPDDLFPKLSTFSSISSTTITQVHPVVDDESNVPMYETSCESSPVEHPIDPLLKDIVDFKLKHVHNFVFIHNNVNSLRHKFAHLQDLLSKHGIDYFAISESKLSDSFPKAMFDVDGYTQFRQDNTELSGGIVVFVRDDLPHRRIHALELNSDGIESICVEIEIGTRKTIFSCMYKNPSVTNTTFKEKIYAFADQLFSMYSDIVILGDLNCCPRKSSVIKDFCASYALRNLIDKPTCSKGPTPSLIDVILVNNRNTFSGVLNCHSHVSDFHNVIGSCTRRFAPSQKPRRISYRSYKKLNESEYCQHISSAPFHVGEIFDDVEDMAWFTSKLLSDIADEHAPIKTKIIKKKSVPYMNGKLRHAMYKRNMSRNKFRKYGKKYWDEYRRQRNLVSKIRQESLQNYFSKNCDSHDKTFWKTIAPFMTDKHSKSGNIILRENDNVIIDKTEICNIFNEYFVNAASSIGFDDEIDTLDAAIAKHASHPSIVKIKERHENPSKFTFHYVDVEDIHDKLKSINIKKATGFDNIPGKLLRIAHQELSVPVTSLLNNCLKNDIFPDVMKYADVSPLFKKADNLCRENYRPVSVLTALSKIYESAVNDQLVNYFVCIFDDMLSAFRKRYSCQNVLLKCIEDWKAALDKKQFVGVLFMDLSKAFDCLPHNLLLAKLDAYGVDSSACKLIASYLSNRKQRVKLGDARSNWEYLRKGVPQGSILGPLLFNIFMNDLFMFIENSDLYNYADDNFLAHIGQNASDVISSLSRDGNLSIQWFDSNGMKANPDKFQFLAISSSDETIYELQLNGGTILKSEPHVKALGVIIDNRLNFSEHILGTCKKAARQLNALARISRFLKPSSRKIIYQSFVASNFNYCPLVWHFCGKTNSHKLEKIQERALKIIYRDYESTYKELLGKSNLPTLLIARLRLLLCEVFKSVKGLNPKYISDMFVKKELPYNLRNCIELYQPKMNTTTYGLRSVTYTGAKLWNDLSPVLTEETDLSDFKIYLNDWHEGRLDPTFNDYV